MEFEIAAIFEKQMGIPCREFEKMVGSRTNDTYRIFSENGQYVLRIPGEGTNAYINREDEIYNLNQIRHLNFLPEIYYADPNTGILIMQYIENSVPLSQEHLKDSEMLKAMCEKLVKLHTSHIRFKNEFDLIKTKDQYIHLLHNMSAEFPDALKEQMPVLDRMMTELMREYPKELVPCHGDIKLENFLLSGKTLWLIDWEYSGMADVCFELINIERSGDEEARFLEAYQSAAGKKIDYRKYILYKIATDYMWIFWHLIKLHQKQMVEYNESSWKRRLERACQNMRELGENL